MQEEDFQALCTAVAALEHPGLAARLAEIAGKPITMFARTLARAQQHILDDGVGTLAVLRARQASRRRMVMRINSIRQVTPFYSCFTKLPV